MGGDRLSPDVEIESRRCIDDGFYSNKPIQGEKDDLYTELWHACAGPTIHVPRAREKVFYFPQGHMEQVEAYTNQDGQMEMPIYNLPYKIPCKVVHVQLKAEALTDEVFAQVTLLPVAKQEGPSPEDETSLSLPRRTHACSYSKILTPSDTNTHGGFSVPKRLADECLPPLDMSQQPPLQELVAKDLHGFEWNFRHIYRGQPKRHLLTSGWSTFVSSKKLVSGDACIFLRGENGELRVGIRRASLQNNASTSVISGHSMQHGILASAFHAISTGTMFTVYCRPWTSPSEFIIPYYQYMKSIENDYSVGTRIRIQFEGEDCTEQRYPGTVVGIEDVDCIRWRGSEWRCLKVKWDAALDASVPPERVSCWNVEPIEETNNLPQLKRPRPLDPSSPGLSILVGDGSGQSSCEYTPQILPNKKEYTPQIHSGVSQGQEFDAIGSHESSAFKPPLSPHLVPPPNSDWGHTQMGLENQLFFPMHCPFYHCPVGTISLPSGIPVSLGFTNRWPPTFTTHGACDNGGVSRSAFVSNLNSYSSGSHEWGATKQNDEIEVPVAQSNASGKYMLFGVNLENISAELPSPQLVTSVELQSPCSVPPTTSQLSYETMRVTNPSKSIAGILSAKECKNCSSITSRSCTKKPILRKCELFVFQVLKYGTALGRSVDLTRFDGYDELICELDHMFDFKGGLIDGSSGWHVTFTDDDGDMMLIGDNPWQEFRSMVQRMFICPNNSEGTH